MRQFFKSTQFKIFALVICALFFGTMLAVISDSSTSPLTKVIGTVFSPIQKFSGYVSEKVNWFESNFASAGAYKTKNDELKEKIAEYESMLADYDEMKHKISSYEDMLSVKEKNKDFELQPANIIGTDAANMFSSLIIDKGSNDKIAVNDPVVCGNYVVGLIKKVNPTYSVVSTLLNPSVNISAIESKTRETAYVTTNIDQAEDGRCILAGLERMTEVSPGGIVLTSGIGGIYPKGLIIGTVVQICETGYDLTNYAVIKPGADIRSLEDVFVITDFEGQGIEQIEN